MKPSGTPTDASWILRLWLEQENVLRTSLQNPTTGDRVGFADLDAMFDYIRQETGGLSNALNEEENHENEG